VVGRCANPECGVPFRYFREGKLFRFDLSVASTPVRIQLDGTARRRIEDFWLCDSCVLKMTLISEDGVGERTQRLPHSIVSLRESIEESPIQQAEA
jgi:hypothetical protein